MINVENEVFSTVATAIRSEFTGIFVSGEAVAAPSTFPAVTLVEMDNSFYRPAKTLGGSEDYSALMYQTDCYSNKSSGRKSECKAILAKIDEQMHGLGFTRINASPVEMAQSNIYRVTARYRAVISKMGTILRIV